MRTCLDCGLTDSEKDFEAGRNVCRECRNLRRRTARSKTEQITTELEKSTGTLTATSTRIKSLEELLKSSGVDRTEWEVERHTLNTWEVAKGSDEGFEVETLYQVKAHLVRSKIPIVEFPDIRPVRFEVNEKFNPFDSTFLPNNYKSALIIPDSQNGYSRDPITGKLEPFHDRNAWDIALQIAKVYQPNKIILLGDMIDNPEFSEKFLKKPEIFFTLQPTITELGWTLAKLRSYCPNAEIVYLAGNHEERINKQIINNLVGLYGIKPANTPSSYPAMSIPNLLGLESLKIKYSDNYPNGEYWLNKELCCIHGDLVGSGSGDTAKKYLNKCSHSVIYGHIHRFEMLYETYQTREGLKTKFAGSPGTIARLTGEVPAVKKYNNWQQGLFWVSFNPIGQDFHIEGVRIDKGKAIFRGLEFKGDFKLEEMLHDTGVVGIL